MMQSYHGKLYNTLMDIFLYSVEPIVESIVHGDFVLNENVGLDFLGRENTEGIVETNHALSFLRMLDTRHPLVHFKRSFDEYGGARNLFYSM